MPSAQQTLTGRLRAATLARGMAITAPSMSTKPALPAMSPHSTTAGAIPARAASTPDPHHRDARRGRKHLPVSLEPSFKHLINIK